MLDTLLVYDASVACRLCSVCGCLLVFDWLLAFSCLLCLLDFVRCFDLAVCLVDLVVTYVDLVLVGIVAFECCWVV